MWEPARRSPAHRAMFFCWEWLIDAQQTLKCMYYKHALQCLSPGGPGSYDCSTISGLLSR